MNEKQFIKLPTLHGSEFINPKDIISVCSNKRKTTVYLNGNVEILTFIGIEKMEKLLDYPYFFRCHCSFIINLLKICSINNGYTSLVLTGGKELPISKHRKTAFKHALSQFCILNNKR